MKVILTQDVEHLGHAGDVKEVANGYARNYLLPRGLVRAATPGAMKLIERQQAAEARRIAHLEEENKSLADLIAKQKLIIEARVGREGRLYGSVTAAQIAEQLSAKIGQEIDRRKVELPENIHHTGTFEIPVKLVGKLAPKVTVQVVADAESAQETEQAAQPAETPAAE